MRPLFCFLVVTMTIGLISPSVSQTAAVEATIVYIECKTSDGPPSRGSGVVVSSKGHVLTARHVLVPKLTDDIPNDLDCRGSTSAANTPTSKLIVQQPTKPSVDVALLRFADQQQQYAFMPFCEFEDWMVRRKIFVAGFPGKTETGAPSFREGVLSTVIANSNGILETDGQTIAGMSGGPVFSNNLSGLVGIVIGANFTSMGTIGYYGILPVAFYDQAPGFDPTTVKCYHRNREVDLPGTLSQWKAGDQPSRLGVHADDGACFLSSVFGLLNDPQDSVRVELQDREYVLTGDNRAGGQHGATARCIWYD